MSNRTSIVIYREESRNPGGRAYLCADGTTSSDRNEAAHRWFSQFDAVVAENHVVHPAKFEVA